MNYITINYFCKYESVVLKYSGNTSRSSIIYFIVNSYTKRLMPDWSYTSIDAIEDVELLYEDKKYYYKYIYQSIREELLIIACEFGFCPKYYENIFGLIELIIKAPYKNTLFNSALYRGWIHPKKSSRNYDMKFYCFISPKYPQYIIDKINKSDKTKKELINIKLLYIHMLNLYLSHLLKLPSCIIDIIIEFTINSNIKKTSTQ